MKHSLALFSAALLIIFISTAVFSSTGTSYIITKSEWGSMVDGDFYSDQPYDAFSQGPMNGVTAVTIHHTYIPDGTYPPNREEDMAKVRSIQRYHTGRGWGDVGYHFLVGTDGAVYEGRPYTHTGTHAPPNSHNLGVTLISNVHDKEFPTEVQLNALVQLIAWVCDMFDVDPMSEITIFNQSNYAVCAHRDWGNTLCPGDRLYALVPTIRERVRAGLLTQASPYNARFAVMQELPETLLAGETYQIPLNIRNTGYTAWASINEIALNAQSDIVSVENISLDDGEIVNPLSNRSWAVTINAPSTPGANKVSLKMATGGAPFGQDLEWDVKVIAQEDLIGDWIAAGPFPADSPGDAFATDYFEGKPLAVLDIMDEESEAAHNYSVTEVYRSPERNYRSETGERVAESGRYFRGEETFEMPLDRYTDGDLVLRKLTDAGINNQAVGFYVNGRRVSTIRWPEPERYLRWKNMDAVIPAHFVRNKDSLDIRVNAVSPKAWGANSFRYTLLDSAEPLAAPKVGEKAGDFTWKALESSSGVINLSAIASDVENGAVYLATYVRSTRTQWAQVRTGYDGFIKAWLNDEQALAGKTAIAGFPDNIRGEIMLKAGWNRLLVKAALDAEANELIVRLSDRNGNPIDGLTYSLNPGN